MNTGATVAKQAVHDKLESQVKLAENKLNTLKAQAENTKANAEIKAIADLFPKKQSIQRKLQDLKKSNGETWNRAKADLETHIADFEKSVKGIESKAGSHQELPGAARSLPHGRSGPSSATEGEQPAE